MPEYRRAHITGGTCFVTVALADRGSALLVERIDDLRRAWAATIRDHPLRCDAMVILPDHLHAVWTLPPGGSAYSERWRKIKHRFSRYVGTKGPSGPSKRAKHETGLWQRRFWEHAIRDTEDYATHVAYCWGNPVRHGLVARAADWPYSSLHRDIRRGVVEREWAERSADGACRV